MRNANFFALGLLALAACGDSKGSSDSDTGSSSGDVVTTGEPTGTGSTTGTGTGDDTTGTSDPTTTTTGDPTSEATQTDSAPTTLEATTEVVTTDAETDSTAGSSTTGGTDDTSGTGGTDTGLMPGGDAIVENTCAPNDGAAVEFKLDVTEPVCGAGWDGDQLRIILFQGAPLPVDTYTLGDDAGFATLQVGNNEPLNAVEGTLTIESWDNDGVSGSYELTFTDNSVHTGLFTGPFCMTMPMCG